MLNRSFLLTTVAGYAVFLQVFAAVPFVRAQTSPLVLTSPNGQVSMRFDVRAPKDFKGQDGNLVYSVRFHDKPVLDDSALGLELDGGPPLGSMVHINHSTPGHGVDDYKLAFQKVSSVHDEYNSLTLEAVEAGGSHRSLDVEARAYNGGVAFRYVLPEENQQEYFRLKAEDTEFRFSNDATNWLLALPNYKSSYESEYVQLPTSALGNQGGVASSFLIGLPVLAHEPGLAWIALMEADLEGNSSMYVTNPSGSWTGHYLAAKLSPRFDHTEYAVEGGLPHHSAWRVILVADEPGRLVESTIQYDLNPASRVADTSWIEAGKASWNWWVDDIDANNKPAFTTENMKRYVDFSAASGFRYMMLDAGWSAIRDLTKLSGKVDVPELVRYAATKNVKVWVWCYAESVMRQRTEAFTQFEKWGVAGVKIDFINRDDQDGIAFFYDTAKEAAEHHLMVDYHGGHTPWGLERTYPNVLSYEAVLGAEQNKVGRRDSPGNRATLAWTRTLAGPMDYTPGGFNNATEDGFVAQNTSPMVMGTRAQQLALYVVYQSPFQMVSDSPQMYAGQPEFQFLKDVPSAWDVTRVIGGTPGEFSTVLRKHGEDWYLGSITNWTPRTLEVPLSFLESGSYTAEIYEDAKDADREPKHVAIRRQTVRPGEMLTLHLAPGGGCAIRFVRAK